MQAVLDAPVRADRVKEAWRVQLLEGEARNGEGDLDGPLARAGDVARDLEDAADAGPIKVAVESSRRLERPPLESSVPLVVADGAGIGRGAQRLVPRGNRAA